MKNLDRQTIVNFGLEWSRFDQSKLSENEAQRIFTKYFSLLPSEELTSSSKVMDVGCGSGRWAALVAPQVQELHVVDPSPFALSVARRNLDRFDNVTFHEASVDQLPVADSSMDVIYSLGVLHHVPDTASALKSCCRKLAPGGHLLVYLYYRFDNRPLWFRLLWRVSDLLRKAICRLPFSVKRVITDLIALLVYWPLARMAHIISKLRRDPSSIPLSIYREASFYTMRTDALDRFGTQLEQRFTKAEITTMMSAAGLVDIRFRDKEPYWCAIGTKA